MVREQPDMGFSTPEIPSMMSPSDNKEQNIISEDTRYAYEGRQDGDNSSKTHRSFVDDLTLSDEGRKAGLNTLFELFISHRPDSSSTAQTSLACSALTSSTGNTEECKYITYSNCFFFYNLT